MPRIDVTMTESPGHEYGSDSTGSKSPLHNFGIFGVKSASTEKKAKGKDALSEPGPTPRLTCPAANGEEPKRRGPKPDAKPAMTRRQELNRQAQRTHRERKELYIKALEQEVLRLKDTYGTACQDRDAFAEENARLRELLAAHGIRCPADLAKPRGDLRSPHPASSSGSFSGSYPPATTPSDPSPGPMYNGQRSPAANGLNGHTNGHANGMFYRESPPQDINDYQVGISFVLALEEPCMDHSQMLLKKSQEGNEDVSGHVLMATCPPIRHLIETPDIQYPHVFPPEIPGGDLLKLLDLSTRLPLEGEITPVMAWAIIIRDERYTLLNEMDIYRIQNELQGKVRCYGFGAVLEEFEVKDAVEGVLTSKMEKLNMMN